MTARPLSRRLVILALAAVWTAGLLSPAPPVGGQQAPIKIGTVFAVTGPASSLGKPEKDTATMLQSQLQSAGGIGGRAAQVITYASETDPAKAVLPIKKAGTEGNAVEVI